MKKSKLWIFGIAMAAFMLSGCITPNNTGKEEETKTEAAEEEVDEIVGYIEPEAGESFYATWASSQYQAESGNQPPIALSGNSIRQIVHASVGGDKIRVKFSNLVGGTALTIKEAHIAKTVSKSQIDISTDKIISFNGGHKNCTIAAGKELYSDLLDFSFNDLECLTVTIYFDSVPTAITDHMGSRTTSYLMKGNHVADESFASTYTCEHWYILAGIDVCAMNEIRIVSCLGDSITDGRGSTTNLQNRWTDILSEQLLANDSTKYVAAINQGIGGTHVSSSGVSRFNRDVLQTNGSYYAIVLYGINDIIANASKDTIVNAYKSLIKKAHNNDVIIYGGTILPFGKYGEYTAAKDEVRMAVNEWIRNTKPEDGGFDSCIDFDEIMASASDSSKMNAAYDSGDGLHPGAAGYKAMGEAIPLSLFTKNVEDYKENWQVSTGSSNVQNIELFKYPLPETVAAGDSVAVEVKGVSNGTKGFRMWLTDDYNGDKSNIYKYEKSGSFAINETFTATATSGFILFKGIQYGTNIEDLTIESLSVTINGTKTSINVVDDIIK